MYGDKERLYIVIGTPEDNGDAGNPILININFYTFAGLKMLNALAWFIDLGYITKKISILPDVCKTNPKFNGYSMSVDGEWVKGKYSIDELTAKGIYKNSNINVRNRKRDELIDELFAYVTGSELLKNVYSYIDTPTPQKDAGTAFENTFTSTFDDDMPPKSASNWTANLTPKTTSLYFNHVTLIRGFMGSNNENRLREIRHNKHNGISETAGYCPRWQQLAMS